MNTARTHVSLDGNWTLNFDPEQRGIKEQWFTTPPEQGGTSLQLPVMQSLGILENGGVGWFFNRFTLDSDLQGQSATLELECTNYPVEVWLNGTRLGDHAGGGTPALFPITAHARSGTNILAVRLAIRDAIDDHACLRYPLDALGRVTMALVPKAHIESIFIQPDIRRRRIAVMVEAPGTCLVHLQVENTPYHVQGAPGELVLEFPEFESWSPESPQCYVLRADLTAPDGSLDSLSTTFGMREFTIKDERFYLNNRPFYLKAVSYQPQYPGTLRPEKLELLLKREVELAKSAGFNALRVEGGPPPSGLLALAASAGMLVFQEIPTGHDDPSTLACLAALVGRDRNEPALVAWCGLPGPDRVAMGLRELDPSRLMLCDAESAPQQYYLRPYRDVPEPYEAFATSLCAPVHQLARDYLRLGGDPERLNVEQCLSAGGAMSWSGATQQAFEAAYAHRQLERCFASPEKFFEASQAIQADAIRTQLDAVRVNGRLMGYTVAHLCDTPEATPFGLADVKRQGKPALKALRPIQQEIRPVIQMQKYNLTPREEVGVTILLINESRLEGRGELSLQVVGPTNQVLWKKKRLVKIPRHGRELWSGEIAASGSPGPHRFVVRLIQERRVIAENAVNLHVVQPAKTEPVEINVPGGRSPIRSAAGRLSKLGNILAPIHVLPPLANSIRAYPASDLMQLFAQVAEGAVALVFQPPEDWNDLAETIDSGLAIKSRAIAGRGVTTHHYAKLHPVFDGLPSRDLMQQAYQDILPSRAFEAESDEEMCGVHCCFPGGEHWWGANFIVRRLGAGRIVFTHFRILEHLGEDPVANRLFQNLLLHFSRRSVPATETVAADQKNIEWLNQERNNALRKWMVLGSFPNWNGRSGHDAILPPEKGVDFEATYPGWYRAIRWKPWWTRDNSRHRIDFHAALDADGGAALPCRYATAFAYAEFTCDRRDEVFLALDGAGSVKAWLNGTLIVNVAEGDVDDEKSGTGWVKQGKNTLLLKYAKGPGPYTLAATVEPVSGAPLIVNWWK